MKKDKHDFMVKNIVRAIELLERLHLGRFAVTLITNVLMFRIRLHQYYGLLALAIALLIALFTLLRLRDAALSVGFIGITMLLILLPKQVYLLREMDDK